MALHDTWLSEVEKALGRRASEVTPLSGGDINEAYALRLSKSERVFIKRNAHSPPRMFEAEAEGLEFLRQGVGKDSPLVIPEVHHVAGSFLVLEMLDREHHHDQSESLGRGLAQLHRCPASSFGAERPNFIGTLGQWNDPADRWVNFFADRRLRVQLDLPGARRLIDRECRRRFDLLFERLPGLLLHEEAPARLHGDLWSGNYLASSRGPAIFDPAAYGGHREVDLAMMRLFGGFSERTFAAYQEAFPLAPDFETRLKIYQLYPLLVHVNLFGAGYVGAVQDTLRQVT